MSETDQEITQSYIQLPFISPIMFLPSTAHTEVVTQSSSAAQVAAATPRLSAPIIRLTEEQIPQKHESGVLSHISILSEAAPAESAATEADRLLVELCPPPPHPLPAHTFLSNQEAARRTVNQSDLLFHSLPPDPRGMPNGRPPSPLPSPLLLHAPHRAV